MTDNQGRIPLHLAALKGDIACLKALVQANNTINSIDKEECIPLHDVALKGSAKCHNLFIGSKC